MPRTRVRMIILNRIEIVDIGIVDIDIVDIDRLRIH